MLNESHHHSRPEQFRNGDASPYAHPGEGHGGGDGDRSIKYPAGELKSMGALGALLIVGGIAAIIIGIAYWFFYGRGPSR